ncbi:MAG: hypothetical protein COB02_11510 [Candidatus Cloacimonadota bacterium]|nr:MAG: hypothetical protein COB02_11510 [Candidatus Cloacimonadota bacterium]
MNIFSLMNIWIVGFLFHLGFCTFFLTFSLIGIKYTYTPKNELIKCESNQLKSHDLSRSKSYNLLIASSSSFLEYFYENSFIERTKKFFSILLQNTLKSNSDLSLSLLFNVSFQRGPPLF